MLQQSRLRPEFKPLLSVTGIGDILGLTIMLENGDMGRFAKVDHYASYCRCVKSERLSNNKKKGEGNRKSGNKYLAWARYPSWRTGLHGDGILAQINNSRAWY